MTARDQMYTSLTKSLPILGQVTDIEFRWSKSLYQQKRLVCALKPATKCSFLYCSTLRFRCHSQPSLLFPTTCAINIDFPLGYMYAWRVLLHSGRGHHNVMQTYYGVRIGTACYIVPTAVKSLSRHGAKYASYFVQSFASLASNTTLRTVRVPSLSAPQPLLTVCARSNSNRRCTVRVISRPGLHVQAGF